MKAQEVIRRPPRSRYDVWVKEGEEIDWERIRKLYCPSLRLQGSTETLGGRADVSLDRVEQEDESKDYERLPQSSEAFIYLAMVRLMVRRLARS